MAITEGYRSILVAVLTILACVQYVTSQCGICFSDSKTMCVSKNQYRACNAGGQPVGSTTTCPHNKVCVKDAGTCVPTGDATVACDPVCGKCGVDQRFGCMNTTSFALCLNDEIQSDSISNCNAGLVCSNRSPSSICVKASEFDPDCTAVPMPLTVCSGLGRVAKEGTRCKQYYNCFYKNSVLTHQTYICEGNTIFSPVRRACVGPSQYTCP